MCGSGIVGWVVGGTVGGSAMVGVGGWKRERTEREFEEGLGLYVSEVVRYMYN